MGHSALLPEEILIGLVKLGEIKDFTANNAILQKAFYDLKRKEDYKELLKPFRFTGSPAAPFSEVLDSALFILQYSNKIRKFNPDLISYQITDKADQYFKKKVQQKLDDTTSVTLVSLAKELREALYS